MPGRHRANDANTTMTPPLYEQLLFTNRTEFRGNETVMSTLQQRLTAFKKRAQFSRGMTMLDPDDLNPGEIVFSADESLGDKSFLSDFFSKKTTIGMGSNLTGLIVLCIVLTAVVVIFFGCYLMMRFMHRALARDDSKDMLRGSSNPYNNVVMHSKRVYEIQAEEGCFTGPPDPLDASEIEEEQLPETPNTSVYIEDEEPQKVRKPESGDLRAIRTENYDDDPRAMLRKKQKVHKDSVCAFLFKPQPEPKMV